MYCISEFADLTKAPPPEDPIERELQEIEDLRRRALANRHILYCSEAVRHLVEREIPRLVEIIRQMRRGDSGSAKGASDLWVLRALAELRQEIDVVRDLVERH